MPAPQPSPRYLDYPRMSDVMADMFPPSTDLGPGDRAPPFDLPTTDGGRLRLEDFARDPRPLLLVFGSLTCPATESGGDGLRALHARYGDRVRFVMVNVREAHPGEALPQPRTASDKLRRAAALRAHHGFPFEVATDDVDGTVHLAFGPRPNSAYLITADGAIRFRARWGNLDAPIAAALEAVLADAALPSASHVGVVPAFARALGVADGVIQRAGRGAMADTLRAAPPLGAMVLLSRALGFVPRRSRGVATLLAFGALTALGVTLALRLG